MKYFFVKKRVNEDAMGGVSAPMATLNNTPGVGNATPASSTAMSGAQQTGSDAIGSGDNWGSGNMYTQKGKLKKKKVKKVEEENLNPYDKIGVMMAKKMKVPMTFIKKNKRKNIVKQKLVSESLDLYVSESQINEEKWIPKDMKKGALSKKLGVPEEKNIPMAVINKKIAALRKKAEGDKKLTAAESKTLHQLMAAKNMKKIKK